jgi:glycosyltransferase involved in cell wall biosynthesis
MEESKHIELSIVVPVYNEEGVFATLVDRLIKSANAIGVDYEVIFVNDGSTDSSLEKIKESCKVHEKLTYISFSRNFGHQAAVTAGMEHASGNVIISIDGDLQDPPELMAQLYNKYLEGNKVVYAQRSKRNGESMFKKIATHVFYRVLAKLVSFDIPLDVGDYRLITRDVLVYLNQMNEYDKYLRGQIAWLGFKSAYVTYERDKREYGKSNYPLGKLLRLAFNGITSFSDRPLRIATKTGFVVCIVSVLLAMYALYSYYIKKVSPPGWASLMITITFLGGVQLLSLGMIGEYIARITNNVRKRPLYVVEQKSVK